MKPGIEGSTPFLIINEINQIQQEIRTKHNKKPFEEKYKLLFRTIKSEDIYQKIVGWAKHQ